MCIWLKYFYILNQMFQHLEVDKIKEIVKEVYFSDR